MNSEKSRFECQQVLGIYLAYIFPLYCHKSDFWFFKSCLIKSKGTITVRIKLEFKLMRECSIIV